MHYYYCGGHSLYFGDISEFISNDLLKIMVLLAFSILTLFGLSISGNLLSSKSYSLLLIGSWVIPLFLHMPPAHNCLPKWC